MAKTTPQTPTTQATLQKQLNELRDKRALEIASRLRKMMEDEGFTIAPEVDIHINGKPVGVKIIVK